MRIRRFLRIFSTIGAYGLDEFIPPGNAPALRLLMRVAFFWRDISRPRGERLRLALESLGPVFVKFGQLLSVRRDLIPEDIADELAKLQDAVPPFAWPEVARALDRACTGVPTPRSSRRSGAAHRERVGRAGGPFRHARGRARGRGEDPAPGIVR
jgi:predicted unusual protein kinase regulating ubiquinone biosynthesis (AarF/ABC1/UbiB family)